ncbi:MAG: Fe(3+) ABC transporter substrate-binding protein [Geminicoccaceae bacterium]
MRRALPVGAALLAIALSMAARADEVNVYSSRHYDTDVQLYDGFEQKTGIKVNLIEANADQLIERIKAEGRNSPADILITVDAGRLYRADEAGVLQPISSKVLEERIPANLRDPENKWFGLSKRVRVIVYAKDRVDPSEIHAYEDLADPKWKGRVCIRSSTNIYNQSMVAWMIEADGLEQTEQWADALVDNLARPPQGADTDQIKAVAAGECDVTIVNHYYLARIVASDDEDDREIASKVGMIFPNQEGRGAEVNISGAGVLIAAPHKENAIKFLEYLTTDQAQVYFTRGNYEYPVVEGVELPEVLNAWGDYEGSGVNAAKYGENNATAVKLMDRAGWK